MSDFLFYVAMVDDDDESAYAACIAEDKNLVRDFYKEHAGKIIRKVNGTEMMRLMNNHLNGRKA